MRKISLVFILMCMLWTPGEVQSGDADRLEYRFGVGGGMGISAVSITDLFSYINQTPGIDPYNRLSEFSTAVEFFGAIDLFVRPTIATGFEYSYLLGSHSIETGFGSYDHHFMYHLPLVLGNYIVAGEGYFFKFGGGLGYILARYEEDPVDFPGPIVYTGGGIGGKAQAIGHTPFGDNLFAYIGAEMRFGFPGSVEDEEGRPLTDGRNDVSFNFFSFGLKFGLMYYF